MAKDQAHEITVFIDEQAFSDLPRAVTDELSRLWSIERKFNDIVKIATAKHDYHLKTYE